MNSCRAKRRAVPADLTRLLADALLAEQAPGPGCLATGSARQMPCCGTVAVTARNASCDKRRLFGPFGECAGQAGSGTGQCFQWRSASPVKASTSPAGIAFPGNCGRPRSRIWTTPFLRTSGHYISQTKEPPLTRLSRVGSRHCGCPRTASPKPAQPKRSTVAGEARSPGSPISQTDRDSSRRESPRR